MKCPKQAVNTDQKASVFLCVFNVRKSVRVKVKVKQDEFIYFPKAALRHCFGIKHKRVCQEHKCSMWLISVIVDKAYKRWQVWFKPIPSKQHEGQFRQEACVINFSPSGPECSTAQWFRCSKTPDLTHHLITRLSRSVSAEKSPNTAGLQSARTQIDDFLHWTVWSGKLASEGKYYPD